MNNKGKKTIVLIIVSLVTIALGAIAVITSLQLRKQTDVAVAPTAPESKPSAALLNNSCELSYDVSASLCDGWCDSDDDCGIDTIDGVDVSLECYIEGGATSGFCRNPACLDESSCLCVYEGVACTSKIAYRVNVDDSRGDAVGNEDVDPGETLEYVISLASGDGEGVVTIEDTLDSNVDFLSSDDCTHSAGEVTCEYDGTMPTTVAYRVTVADDLNVGTGTITNEATVTDSYDNVTTCSEELSWTVSPVSCNESCDEDTDCSDDLICDSTSGACRLEEYPDEEDCTPPAATPKPTPTPTPTATPTITPTVKPTPTPTTTTTVTTTPTPEPTLPTAGSILPTTTLLSIGTLLLLIGAMSVLAL